MFITSASRSHFCDAETGDVILQADHALGPATVKLLDHHRVPLATKQQAVTQDDNVFVN
jgi:hypothetical protein